MRSHEPAYRSEVNGSSPVRRTAPSGGRKCLLARKRGGVGVTYLAAFHARRFRACRRRRPGDSARGAWAVLRRAWPRSGRGQNGAPLPSQNARHTSRQAATHPGIGRTAEHLAHPRRRPLQLGEAIESGWDERAGREVAIGDGVRALDREDERRGGALLDGVVTPSVGQASREVAGRALLEQQRKQGRARGDRLYSGGEGGRSRSSRT